MPACRSVCLSVPCVHVLCALLCLLCHAVLCSNTLVVDDLEEARRLCYGPDRHKVVSVDGTMFKPNGTFTGVRASPAP